MWEACKFGLVGISHSDWGPDNVGLAFQGSPKWLPLQSGIRAELWLPPLRNGISLSFRHVNSRNHLTLGMTMICEVEEITSIPTMWLSLYRVGMCKVVGREILWLYKKQIYVHAEQHLVLKVVFLAVKTAFWRASGPSHGQERENSTNRLCPLL